MVVAKDVPIVRVASVDGTVDEQLTILHDMRPMLIQGFLASRPVPAEQFDVLLHQGGSLLPAASV